MRKPRDLDAELKALADRQRSLKSKRIAQLGELVIATGADTLAIEVLAGTLLDAASRKTGDPMQEAWRTSGAAFFRSERHKGSGAAPTGGGDRRGAPPDSSGA